MSTRKFLVTGFVVLLMVICLAGAAYAAPVGSEIQGMPSLSSAFSVLPEIDLPVIKDLTDAQKVPSGELQNKGVMAAIIGKAVSGENKEVTCSTKPFYPVMGTETGSLSAEEQQMYELVNRERSSNGSGQLASDPALTKLARLKAQDMVDNHYFDHTSPTYGSPFDMLKKFGISYSYAGENLAMAPSVSSAHNALMQSPGHRANILNKNFDRVGIGIVVSGGYRYCVQLFTGGQRGSLQDDSDQQQSQSSQTPQTSDPSVNDSGLTADELTLVNLINQERVKAGVPKLEADSKLFQVAGLKAKDFVDNNYFSHTSPTYGSYKEMLRSYGVSFVKAGENLAATYTAARAHTSLMNSSGNRANILNADYKRVGIGIADNGKYKYFVEMFTDGGSSSQPSSGGNTQPSSGGSTQPSSGGSTSPDTGSTAGLSADEQKMLNLVNAERQKAGAAPLKVNMTLTKMARVKGQDMINKNYFDHNSPTYGSPFDMMHQFGVSYRTAGENLAGAPTVDMAHTNLMNSPGHRANILNSSFREVGIGIVNGGPYGKMFVQEFIG